MRDSLCFLRVKAARIVSESRNLKDKFCLIRGKSLKNALPAQVDSKKRR
ncbi:unnamed protein product [Acidithrix sp. C25]|nr:unnamed protein product [Acidithrix sp. C25]